jgi:streptogramin lyase
MIAPSLGEIVLLGGFFSGNVDKFDTTTGAITTFSPIANGGDPFPGISGLAYNPFTNSIYVSARVSNRIYSLNGFTGAVTGFKQLADGSSPASVAVDKTGSVYVANNSGNNITVFNSNFDEIRTLTVPNFGVANNQVSGLALDGDGNLIVSTFGGIGVVKYDPAANSFSSFNTNPVANGQVAIDGSGNVYVGGAAFANSVAKLSSTGASTGSIEITDGLLPLPPQSFASPNFTSPSGVAIRSNGDIVVAALGRTNPTQASDNFQSNGGVFLFGSDGTFKLSTVQTTPYSTALSFTAVPEPSSVLAASVGLASFAWLRRRRRALGVSQPNSMQD